MVTHSGQCHVTVGLTFLVTPRTVFPLLSELIACWGTGLAQDLSNESPKRKVDWQNVPKLTLQLADQQAFLDRHGSKVGLHARNIRSIAAPVSA